MKIVDEVHSMIWEMCKFNVKTQVKKNGIYSENNEYQIAKLILPSFIVNCFDAEKISGYTIEDKKENKMIYYNKTNKEEFLIDPKDKRFEMFFFELIDVYNSIKKELKRVRSHEDALFELAATITQKLEK